MKINEQYLGELYMNMKLRGHHLLCVLGYRGRGYSKEFCENMTFIYETLRVKPDTLIEIIKGSDDICKHCPKKHHLQCENVYEMDSSILNKIGLCPEMKLSWSEICKQIKAKLIPEDISNLCRTCQWRSLGLCEEGVRLVNNGLKLPIISPVPQQTDAF